MLRSSLPVYAIYVFLFVFSLSLFKNPVSKFIIISFLFLAQLINFSHINHYGTPVTPEALGYFFCCIAENSREIVDAGAGLNLQVLLMLVGIYSLIFMLSYRMRGRMFSSFTGCIMLFCVLGFAAQRPINASVPYKFYPRVNSFSVGNIINAVALYNLSSVKSLADDRKWPPYKVIKKEKGTRAANIILIIGESCSNKYMSLFGEPDKTTPLLDAMANDENFIFKPMISSSVSTFPSTTLLLNIIREPGNLSPIYDKSHNLFYLAKKHGYRTGLISAQTISHFTFSGLEKSDHVSTEEANRNDGKVDDVLLEALPNYQFGPTNFIVINQRNMHYPYDAYSHHKELALFSDEKMSREKDEHHARLKRYKNAMRYNDYIVSNLINYFKSQFADSAETYIFYTSDHGEMLGEEVDGQRLYTHNMLEMDVARVPFIVYGINPDPYFWETLKSKNALTHYDLGVMIADRMGFTIENPSYQKGHYYLISADMFNLHHYIAYEIMADGKIQYNKVVDETGK